MAQRGRRIEGPKTVEGMDGSERAKQRLEVILETISGSKSITDACTELGIGRSAFYDLRQKALQYALDAMEPGLPGRPRTAADPEEERVSELEQELTDLKIELEASRIREELAIAMPHVLEGRQEQAKKKKAKKKKAKRKQEKKRKKQARKSRKR
jgi:hypothetical protein